MPSPIPLLCDAIEPDSDAVCLNSQYVVIWSSNWVLTPKLSWYLFLMFPLYIGLCILFDGDVIPLYSGVCSNTINSPFGCKGVNDVVY